MITSHQKYILSIQLDEYAQTEHIYGTSAQIKTQNIIGTLEAPRFCPHVLSLDSGDCFPDHLA